MTKSLLRSGSLADFFALGENGQPVYTSALQLRETLRLRRHPDIADCLAIPQPNEAGDRIDWYAPGAGKVSSWMAASDDERETALALLETHLSTVATLSQQALKSEKTAQQRFGALLSKAFQFPATNYVYLVDGRPVMTFWGFINLDQKPRTDAFACLREVLPAINTQELVETPVPTLTTTLTDAPLVSPAASAYAETSALPLEPEHQPEPQVEIPGAPVIASSSSRTILLRRWWWVVPGVAIIGALVWQFRAGVPAKPAATTAAVPMPEKRALPATEKPVEPEAVTQNVTPIAPPPLASADAPVDKTTLPVESAKAPVTAAPLPVVVPQANVPETENKPVENKPVEKNALVMPHLAIKLGKTDFLNGNWRVTLDIKTPSTGEPASLRYQIKEGQGTVSLNQGDGVTCRTTVTAGLMQSGNLIINSRVKARCSDGSRYQMPEIVCSQAATGAAECTGRYENDTVLPLTMKRESE